MGIDYAKNIYSINEIKDQAVASRREIFTKGYSTGFSTGDPKISYKPGYSTGVYSYSHQGKTQFVLEQCVWLAIRYGIKTAYWLSESGKKNEAALDIAMIYAGYFFGDGDEIPDEVIFDALDWVGKFFYGIDHEEEHLNVRDIYASVQAIEKKYSVKIGMVVIDHVGNLDKEDRALRLAPADYIKYIMQAVNRTSLKWGLHTIILFHVRDTEMIKCKHTEKLYLPEPSHYHIAGGQQVNYLGMQLIGVWRPVLDPDDYGIVNPKTGVPYELNESHIRVTKSKPKMIGSLGKFILRFDKSKQMYYEEIDGHRFYRGEYELKFGDVPEEMKPKSAIQPSSSWYEVDKEPELDFEKPHGFIIRPSENWDTDDNEPF